MPHDPVSQAIGLLKASPNLSPAFKRGLDQAKAEQLELRLAAANRIIADQSAVIASAFASLREIATTQEASPSPSNRLLKCGNIARAAIAKIEVSK